MPKTCSDCGDTVRPLASEFDVEGEEDETVWFLVCPKCHFVFDKYDDEDFSTAPR